MSSAIYGEWAGLGIISYPLYLWHWPLLSYVRMGQACELSLLSRVLIVALSVLLSIATYSIVEKPIRVRSSRAFSLGTLVKGMVLVACFGTVAANVQMPTAQHWNERLYEAKWQDIEQNPQAFLFQRCPPALRSLQLCQTSSKNNPTYALFGDSHADHLFNGLARLDTQETWLAAGEGSCPPITGIASPDFSAVGCVTSNEKTLAYLSNQKSIQTVVLAFYGEYAKQANAEPLFQGLLHTIQTLEKHGKKIIVVIDIPSLPFSPWHCFGQSSTAKPGAACWVSVTPRVNLD